LWKADNQSRSWAFRKPKQGVNYATGEVMFVGRLRRMLPARRPTSKISNASSKVAAPAA
jgi:hypothetical protein